MTLTLTELAERLRIKTDEIEAIKNSNELWSKTRKHDPAGWVWLYDSTNDNYEGISYRDFSHRLALGKLGKPSWEFPAA